MKKIIVLLLTAALTISLLGGCAKKNQNPVIEDTKAKETETENQQKELIELNVAYMPNYASLSAVVAGIKTGAFEEQGFKINLVEFADGPTIIAAMESGSIDFGYIGQGAHKLAIQGNATVFCFDHYENAGAIIGNKSKGVTSMADLKGKTIAMASGTSSEFQIDLTLAKAGLTRDDVTLMDMDASSIVTAMTSGGVDAASTWSPNTSAIMNELGDDAIVISNNATFLDTSPFIASWIVMPDYANENTESVLAFTKALYKAMDYRAEHVDEVVEWVAEIAALDLDTMKAQKEDGIWNSKDEIVELINAGDLQSTYEVQQNNFIDSGAVAVQVPVDNYVLFQNMLDAAK